MIIDKLLEKFPDMQALRVRDIKVDKVIKKVSCVVSYPEMDKLPKSTQNAIREVVASTIPNGYRYETVLVNDKFNPTSLRAAVLDVLKKYYPLFANLKTENVLVAETPEGFSVTFNVNKTIKLNMEVDDFLQEFDELFKNYTSFNVTFAVQLDQNLQTPTSSIQEQERLVQLAINKEMLKPRRYFDVTDVQKYIGKEVKTKPMYISDVRKPMELCVVCGRVSGKSLREVKNNPNLHICKFTLTDDSGASIQCVMFVRLQTADFEILRQESGKPDSEVLTLSKKRALSNEKKLKHLMFLTDGIEVVVRGKVVHSNFSDSLEMQVYDVSKCRIQPLNTQPTFERDVPASYVLVTPTQVTRFRQLDFTNDHSDTPSVIADKTYAVLYVNATGLSQTKDKIFSICAVKIVGGRMAEKFQTHVQPEMVLTDQQLATAKVSVRDLALCPTLTEIIPDLYRFLDGTTLIGVDLPAIIALLNYYGAPLGFNFNNQIVAPNEILSQLFDHSDLPTKPNCAKLEDVARILKVSYKTTTSSFELATAIAECIDALADHSLG